MAKKSKVEKIGALRFTENEQQLIAQFVESDIYKIIKYKMRKNRQIQIGQDAVRAGQTLENLWYYKGEMAESDWLITQLDTVADRYNKVHLEPDSDDLDTVD